MESADNLRGLGEISTQFAKRLGSRGGLRNKGDRRRWTFYAGAQPGVTTEAILTQIFLLSNFVDQVLDEWLANSWQREGVLRSEGGTTFSQWGQWV